ncbi:S-layer homology domain-containing protein [Heyndrickxia oleronia]|uniref:S-layer homology domain-containing protein n=1 Tax=Heyndrickxia oleronia TaxID=38875 RepID=UPI001C0F01B5|nr:S-layer homology domain-containing protein [Heyndrickxia oleronia]MBU5211648.1 S-layer homology domain-containing protein [Heyndrickxia oleronia]
MAKKSRKVFATTATAALVASAVAPIASSAAGFSDVTKPEYKTAIDALAEAGILNGYENGTFKPENKVTRGEVAKVITLIRHLEEGTKTPFKDVKDGYWSTQYINSLYAAKLVNGYEDGTFKPEGNVTRAEFAKLVVDAYGLTLTNAATPFTDVKAGNWATPYIQTAYANGLIKGVTASKFDPSAPIKRGDLAILLHRADSKFGDVIGNNFPGVELVKATNTTTVEVTFKEAVEAKDVKAANFSIEGLTVSNAAVKQTDSKTVVLTTSTQEGGKQYTVKSGAATLGKFIGVSAVTPEKVEMVTNSLQGIVGKEVTVKAQVTVKDGQSKAGIPVTFNISRDSKFNDDKVVEVYTNEEGVAQYSYTQYAGGDDTILAYATGNASVRAQFAKVYWGVKDRLAIEEVTKENELANGAKKVYKVKMTNPDGSAAKGYVNVAFAENVDVTPDKGVKGVTVTDASFGKGTAPYQYTNGNTNAVRVVLDSKGEATFTVSGSDVSVTPIVFADNGAGYNSSNVWVPQDDKLAANELQAKAPTVKFSNIQLVELAVESLGTKDAAGISAASDGGRDYKVTVKGKDGKVAPKGTKVYLTVTPDDLGIDTKKNEKVYYQDADGKNTELTGKNTIELLTDKDGVAEFTLVGSKNAYATPTVYVDNGSKSGELDKSDAQAKGEIVYFGDAVVNSAVVKVTNEAGKVVETVKANEKAIFEYQVVDQNGKDYKVGSHNATFEVFNNGYNTIYANGVEVKPFKHESVPFTASNGKSTLTVTSTGITSVEVNVSGSQYSLGNQTAKVGFTDSNELIKGVAYTGTVKKVDISKKQMVLTISGVDHTLTYANDKLFVKNSPVSENAFETALTVGDTITYINNDVESYDIVDDVIAKTDLENAITAAEAIAVKEADYTTESFAPFKAALDSAKTVNSDTAATQEQVNKAKNELTNAQAKLVKKGALDVSKVTVSVDSTKANAGELTLTFTSTEAGLTGFDVTANETIAKAFGDDTTATVADGADGKLVVTVKKSDDSAFDLTSLTSANIKFNAVLKATDKVDSNVEVALSYTNSAWASTVTVK